jgi:hypothetical protein
MHTYIPSFLRAPFMHTWTPAQASAYTCVRTRARASAVPPCRIEDRPSASAAVARRRPKSGAYRVQVADARGVPRADVCVERRSPVERLRAEPHAVVHAGGKDSHVWARIRVPPNAHARTLTRAHGCAT